MLIIFLLEVLGDLKIQLISIVNFYDRATPVKSKKRRLAMLMGPTILTISIGWKICRKIESKLSFVKLLILNFSGEQA